MAQAFGFLAVATFLLSFQLKTRQKIILANAMSRLLYVLQYIFLGAFEGAVLDMIGLLSSVIAKYKESKFIAQHAVWIVVMINVFLMTVGILLYQNIFSLFAMLGIMFEITALWLTKEKNIRFLSFFSAPFWFIYNFANMAYGSAVGNLLTMVSIGIAMCRLDFKR